MSCSGCEDKDLLELVKRSKTAMSTERELKQPDKEEVNERREVSST